MTYNMAVNLSDIMKIYSKNHKVGNKNGIAPASLILSTRFAWPV